MNEKEVITLLKKSKTLVPDGAMERCIESLPCVSKKTNMLSLIKIQIYSIPVGVYITAVVAVVLQLLLAINVRPSEVLFLTGISNALIAMLFGWHFLLSYVGSMTEIERTCRYSYGQILLARIFCVGALTFITMLVAIIPNAGISNMGIPFLLATVLPTLFGTSATLFFIDYTDNSSFSQMSVYMMTAMITSFMLEFVIGLSIVLLVVIFFAASIMLFVQTKNQVNRRIYYET